MRAPASSAKSSRPDPDGGADVGPLGQTFAREVRRLRELRGLSQTDLAAQLRDRYGLKFHQATIDRLEKGSRPCRLDEVYALAEVLGSTVDDMLADWSSADTAFRELTSIARRAGETEYRIAMGLQQELAAIDGDRERVVAGLARSRDSADSDQVQAWAEEVLELLNALSAGAQRILEGITAHVPLRPGGVMEEVNRQYFGGILAAHEAAVAARRAQAEAADPQARTDAEPG
ncbi:MAG: helix-turn-helix transcriptional regulator [Actinobacteria bacterium]|jgi:transcriptional regulator with XRE-family HTH domain|nr:helix-turn-helix transcriptional regulator [Actinomycetota bacterium]